MYNRFVLYVRGCWIVEDRGMVYKGGIGGVILYTMYVLFYTVNAMLCIMTNFSSIQVYIDTSILYYILHLPLVLSSVMASFNWGRDALILGSLIILASGFLHSSPFNTMRITINRLHQVRKIYVYMIDLPSSARVSGWRSYTCIVY